MNEILFDLLDRVRNRERLKEYFWSPIPSPMDDELSKLVDLFIQSDSTEVGEALSLMTNSHMDVLRNYAERNASRSVRERRPELISHALSALAIASKWADTPTISTTILSLLYRSGELIDLPAITESTYPIAFDNPEFVDYWNQFRARCERDRTIEVMRYAEGTDQDGFRYVNTELPAMLRRMEKEKAAGGEVPDWAIANIRRAVEEHRPKGGYPAT